MSGKGLDDAISRARDELSAARAQLDAVTAQAENSLADPVAFAKWKASHSNAVSEEERLTRLVTKLESDAAATAAREAEEAQRKIEAAANRAADAAAALVEKNLGLIRDLAREMLAAVAKADLKIANAQATRSADRPADGWPGLSPTEQRVRSHDRVERQVVSEEVINRWCYSESGDILTDELAARVFSPDGKQGQFTSDIMAHRVVKRKFRKVAYRDEKPAQTMRPLAESLVIPGLRPNDLPVWSPITIYRPSTVLELLEQRAEEPAPSEARIELIPMDAEAGNVAA